MEIKSIKYVDGIWKHLAVNILNTFLADSNICGHIVNNRNTFWHGLMTKGTDMLGHWEMNRLIGYNLYQNLQTCNRLNGTKFGEVIKIKDN